MNYNNETTVLSLSNTAVYYTVTIINNFMTSYLVYLRGTVRSPSDPHQCKLLQ